MNQNHEPEKHKLAIAVSWRESFGHESLGHESLGHKSIDDRSQWEKPV